MCRALTEAGFEIHLATLPMGETIALPGLIYHRVARVPFLSQVPIGFSFAKMIYGVLLAGTVVRRLRKERFVAVHAIEEAAFYAVPIARWFRTPAIADLDSDLVAQLRANPSAVARLLAGTAAGAAALHAAPGDLRRHGRAGADPAGGEPHPDDAGVRGITDVAPAALLRAARAERHRCAPS